MIVSVMQPYLFPYIGYWQLISSSDVFVILDDVNYINRGWINRNRLLLNAEPQYFNIRLSGASQNKLINEIERSDDNNAVVKQLQTIYMAYKKAPFFEDTFPLIEDCFKDPEMNLAVFLANSIRKTANHLGITTRIEVSSMVKKDSDLRGQNRIIALCKAFGANEYHNPIGGVELYDRKLFADNGMNLYFVQSRPEISYKQFCNTFVPWLSILDVMMFNSKHAISEMLTQYDLI